jgi:hypothetical protein
LTVVMNTQHHSPDALLFRSSVRPPRALSHEDQCLDAARGAVRELRNRLLVFYSASAWARTQRSSAALELRDAAYSLERAAETLRGPLVAFTGAVDATRREDLSPWLVPSTGEAVRRFVASAEEPMVTMRRTLMAFDLDGIELLADLEDALARVRECTYAFVPLDAS